MRKITRSVCYSYLLFDLSKQSFSGRLLTRPRVIMTINGNNNANALYTALNSQSRGCDV